MLVTEKCTMTLKGCLISAVLAIRVRHTLIFKDPPKAFFQEHQSRTTAQPPQLGVGCFPPATSISLVDITGKSGVDIAPFAENPCWELCCLMEG